MSKTIAIKNSIFDELSKYKNGIEMSWSDTLEIFLERSRENIELKKTISELQARLEVLSK